MHWTSAAVDSVTLERDSLGRVHKTHSFRSHSQSASDESVRALDDPASRVSSSPARAHVPVPSFVDSRRRTNWSLRVNLSSCLCHLRVLLRPASPAACQIVGRTWQCFFCQKKQMVSWFEWVHTGSNPADALTRPRLGSVTECMGLELEEAMWISKCPAAVQ